MDIGAKLFYHITHESFISWLKYFQLGVYRLPFNQLFYLVGSENMLQ